MLFFPRAHVSSLVLLFCFINSSDSSVVPILKIKNIKDHFRRKKEERIGSYKVNKIVNI
jgi:hypothetical protein